MNFYQGAFGGNVDFNYMKVNSPFTLIIIAINIAIYLFANLLSLHEFTIIMGGMIPLQDIIASGQYWRFLSAVFIHGNFMHMAFNMVILYHAGAFFEQKYGSKSFLFFYILTGLFVSLCSGIFSKGISIGASGAIFALLGYILHHDQQLRKVGIYTNNVILPLVIINVIMTLIIPTISTVGHFSGLIIGYLVAYYFASKNKIRIV